MASRLLDEYTLTAAQRRACPPVGVFAGPRCELLRQLCYPVSPAAFLKTHWRKRALAVHGDSERTAAFRTELLHGLSLTRLLQDTPSEEIHVWFASKTGGGNESFKTADVEAALASHRAGGSLYFRAPAQASELLVTALSQQVGLSFGALYADGAPRSEVETFVSRAGNVTNWHYDFMENFTLQARAASAPAFSRGARLTLCPGLLPVAHRLEDLAAQALLGRGAAPRLHAAVGRRVRLGARRRRATGQAHRAALRGGRGGFRGAARRGAASRLLGRRRASHRRAGRRALRACRGVAPC